jgi:hypothetical protein
MNFLVPLIVSAAASGLKAAAKGAKADDVGSPPPPAQPITSSVDPFSRLTDRRMMAVKKALE